MKLRKTSLQIHKILSTVYEDSALKKTALFKWIMRFREGREDCKDDARSGRLSTTCDDQNIERVQSPVLSDRRMTVRMLADMLSIGKSSVHTILTENVGLRKFYAKIVPKLLTPDQKLRRKECCIDWEKSTRTPNFLERIITGYFSLFPRYKNVIRGQHW